jgi:hypothetical protein
MFPAPLGRKQHLLSFRHVKRFQVELELEDQIWATTINVWCAGLRLVISHTCRYASLLGDNGSAVVAQKVYWNDKCPTELLVSIQVAAGSIGLAEIMPQASAD